MSPIHTVGHGTLSADRFGAVVVAAGVDFVVDVRRYPGSRRHPHFARDDMAAWLPAAGVGYCWMAALGGRRTPTSASANTGWRNPRFRAYADYMATAEFGAGVTQLEELAASQTTAVMCSESVWWRCHRRLLADHLVVVEGIPVVHLFHDGRLTPHQPLDGLRRDGSHVTYSAAGSLDRRQSS